MKAGWRNRKIKRLRKCINGTRGVISLFLAILMLPFLSIAGILIQTARFNSAIAIFDEALCNASNSTLGTYDSFLKTRFGLLAMEQNTAERGGDYTVQDLISDTFQLYMEENGKSLSNTYSNMESTAAGVYPLADTDVLLSQVLEYSKYTVPAKLVVDGMSLDSILSSLTKDLQIGTNVFNTLSAGAGMADKLMACQDKFDALETALSALTEAKSSYETAYDTFVKEVNTYNTLLDEMAAELTEVQNETTSAQSSAAEAEDKLETEAEQYPDLVEQLEALETERDDSGNLVDNSAQIQAFKQQHETELADYFQAREELEQANKDVRAAQDKASDIQDSYISELEEQRAAVKQARDGYSTKIQAYAGAMETTGNAVMAAQSSATAAANAGVTLVTSIGTNLYDAQKTANDKQVEDLKSNLAEAQKRNNTDAVNKLQQQITKAETNQIGIANENTLQKAYAAEASSAIGSLDEFSQEKYQQAFSTAYSQLIALRVEVDKYTVPTQDVRMKEAAKLYVDIDPPLTLAEVQELRKGLAGEVAESSFLGVMRALVAFIQAIFSMRLITDPELNAVIDASIYEEIGGLPSEKKRGEGSEYALSSEYEAGDSALSQKYKELLGTYSSSAWTDGSVSVFESVVSAIMADIDTISSCCDPSAWEWGNVFSRLADLSNAIEDIVNNIVVFLTNIVQILAETVYQKALLAGYIGYNTANRTTYKQTALTNQAYDLPSMGSEHQNMAFCGGETEYIIVGFQEESLNLTGVFGMVLLLRFVYDIAFVLTNQEVASIAGQTGAATFGIGTIIVYVLYLLAEPMVDTLVLVNGSDVPLIKTTLFLTPSGIISLVGKFYKMKLSDDQKNTAYMAVTDIMGAGFNDTSFAANYADAVSAFGTSSSIMDTVCVDYTQTLILLLMLTDTNTMLERLSDIIQMECTYHIASTEIATYPFDLDKSYTYLRASGKFTASEFIQLSDIPSGLTSTERILYRGY